MLDNIQTENILFLDIETVPVTHKFNDLPENLQQLWDKKSKHFREDSQEASEVYERAGIYSEFGKIVCISVGFITRKNGKTTLRLKSFADHDEKKILIEFNTMLDKYFSKEEQFLCAHNGKEFDFPYIARRTLINGLKLPKTLDIAGKKPWEIKHLDTMELWKFGDYKHYTPLSLLTAVFNIPTPKDDIDGSDVARVFYEEKDLPRIVTYCQKDVLAIAQLFLRYKGEELIKEENVEIQS